jgi:hypothetical protein
VDNPQQRVHSLLLFQFCALHDWNLQEFVQRFTLCAQR